MERRDFIKGACRICLLGAAVTGIAADLSSCSPSMGKNTFKTPVKDNQVIIPLSLFDSQPFRVISPDKFQYEIAVQKNPDNTYAALLLKCTHYQNQLTVTGNGFTCSAHGSKFDKEGNIIKGPAELSLEKLDTRIIKNDLLINL